jgi:hypothetical protein
MTSSSTCRTHGSVSSTLGAGSSLREIIELTGVSAMVAADTYRAVRVASERSHKTPEDVWLEFRAGLELGLSCSAALARVGGL